MNPKVRQALELLDQQFAREGGPPYSALEAALEDARHAGDAEREEDAGLQMAIRLSSIATFASAMALSGRELPSMPSAAEGLEPAIQLCVRVLDLARRAATRRARSSFATA
jgi:hypothetical protein